MTEFLGDWSNHDWGRGSMDFAAMRRDGIRGGTHKTSDGLNFYRDPYWPGAIGRMRSAFADGVYGSYHVLWGNRSTRAQIDWWFSILDATAPGWRTDPQFALMSDNEPFGYNAAPTIAQVNETGDIIRALTGKTMLAYCPPWHYGAALGSLRYPLVSSNYGSNPIAHYRAAYPGDGSARWGGAALLQYGSRTRMGAQSTCDANAYRGTLDQLRALITGTQQAAPPATKGPSMIQVKLGPTIVLTDYATWHKRLTFDELEVMRKAGMVRVDISEAEMQRILALPQPGTDEMVGDRLSALAEAVANVQSGGQPTPEQVDAAVLAAMRDPNVLKGIGDAIASHLHVT